MVALFSMPELYWNPLSINQFIHCIMTLILGSYFGTHFYSAWRTDQHMRVSLLLFITFLFSFIGISLQLLSDILHPHYINYALPPVSVAGAFAMAAYVMFTYYLNDRPALGERFGKIMLAMFGLIIAIESYVSVQRYILLQNGFVEFRDAWLDVPFTVFFFLAHLFLFAHLLIAISEESDRSVWQSVLPALRALTWPGLRLERKSATARAFFYVAMMPMTLAMVHVFRSYGIIEWRLAEVLISWLFLLTVASLGLAYLNYIPEHSSFRVKLVGVTLIVVLSILCGISWVIGNVYADNFESEFGPKDRMAVRFEPTQDGGYQVARTRYSFSSELGDQIIQTGEPVEMPFAFPFYDKSYTKLYPHQAGMVGFHQLPFWRDIDHRFGPQPAIFVLSTALNAAENVGADGAAPLPSGMYIDRKPSQTTITWNRLASAFKPDEIYTFQLKLYPSGVIEMVYGDLPDKPLADFYLSHAAPMLVGIVPAMDQRDVTDFRLKNLPVKVAAGTGLIEYLRIDFLTYLNRIYEPLAWFILASAITVLVVFPWFFTINLDRPLQNLIRGVQHFRGGQLSSSIAISYRDEIGYLAASFNDMANAQHDLIHTLEDKVAERTAEASAYAEQNARLEERNHLSRELHDAVSQTLFSANLVADTLPALMARDPDLAKNSLNEMRQLNKDALSEMRQLLVQLRSQKLTSMRFGHLLSDLTDNLTKRHDMDVEISIVSDAILPEQVQPTFYRIAQECLANVVKHSNATKINVQFDGIQTQAMLIIQDNGRGFNIDNVSDGHFGLQIMKERMASIGGTLEIDTKLGEGTIVTAIWIENGRE